MKNTLVQLATQKWSKYFIADVPKLHHQLQKCTTLAWNWMKGILSLTSDMKLWQQKCRERHVYYETPQFCYIAILEDSAGTISMQTCWCFSGEYLKDILAILNTSSVCMFIPSNNVQGNVHEFWYTHIWYHLKNALPTYILEDSAGTISMQTCWCFSGGYFRGILAILNTSNSSVCMFIPSNNVQGNVHVFCMV